MKRFIAVLSLMFFVLGCKEKENTTVENQSNTEFKQSALSQELLTTEGNLTTFKDVLSGYQGKIVLIDVWASWCPDCIEGMPKVHQLQSEFQDVVYLFLSYDKTEEAWKNGIEKLKVVGENFLIQSDWKTGEFRKAIDLDWIPRYILVDKSGKIAHYRAIEADNQELISKIKELTKSEERRVGKECSTQRSTTQ